MPYLPAEQRPGLANGAQPKALDMRTPAADLILTLQRNNTARWFGAQAVRVVEVGLFCADGHACSLPGCHLLRVGGAGGQRV